MSDTELQTIVKWGVGVSRRGGPGQQGRQDAREARGVATNGDGGRANASGDQRDHPNE